MFSTILDVLVSVCCVVYAWVCLAVRKRSGGRMDTEIEAKQPVVRIYTSPPLPNADSGPDIH